MIVTSIPDLKISINLSVISTILLISFVDRGWGKVVVLIRRKNVPCQAVTLSVLHG